MENQRMVKELSIRLSPLKVESRGDEEEGHLDMSDEDLYERLKQFDSDTGPITRSTRKIYAKKLTKYLTNSNNSSFSPQRWPSRMSSNIGSEITNTSAKYDVHGGGDVIIVGDDDDDDEGLVEGDDDEDDLRASQGFRTYPASFSYFSPSSSARSRELEGLIKSANDTFNASHRSATETLNSSFKYNLLDHSAHNVLGFKKSDVDGYQSKSRLNSELKYGVRPRMKVDRKVAGTTWCGVVLKMLAFILFIAILVLCVVVFKSLDKDYKINIQPEEWVKWGRKWIGGCVGWIGGCVEWIGGGVEWVKGLRVVGWIKEMVNEWVVWVQEFELIG